MAVPIIQPALTDVIAEVSVGTNNSLQDCVNNADTADLDGTYYTFPLDRLSDFRNYDEGSLTPTMNISPNSVASQPQTAGSFTISVSSNTTWSISDDASWVTITGASGSGNDLSITISYTANTTGSPRNATITATTTSGSPTASDTLTFTQLSGFE
jgi:hypothetical protein